MGGTCSCLLVGRAGACPLVGRVVSGDLFSGQPSKDFKLCFADRLDYVPTLLVSSIGAYKLLGGARSWRKNGGF